MSNVDDRSDLAPRAEPGALRAFGLAMLVHLLLLIALTWGVSWKSKDLTLSFEAELWSALPQEAAPPLEAPPTPPEPVQAKMMWIMPLVFSVMFFYFPAGLVLYWLTNNILGIAQQWYINKKLGVA